MAFHCVFCGSGRCSTYPTRDAKDGKPLTIAACLDCGLVQLRDLPDDSALSRFYATDYRQEYRKAAQPKPRHIYNAGLAAQRRLDLMAPWVQPGQKLLDIGAGGGEFVYLATRRGLEAEGIDPNGGYLDFARAAYGVPLRLAEVADLQGRARFDVITMFHVLEHLAHPADVVAQVHYLLLDGGIFVVEVPNFGSPALAPGNVFFKAHITYFTPPSLQLLMADRFETLMVEADKVLYAVFRKLPQRGAETGTLAAQSAALSQERLRQRGYGEYLRSGGFASAFRSLGKRLRIARAVRDKTARQILDTL